MSSKKHNNADAVQEEEDMDEAAVNAELELLVKKQKKMKRGLAIFGLAIMAVLVICLIICLITGSELTTAVLFCTILYPILLYLFLWVKKVFS